MLVGIFKLNHTTETNLVVVQASSLNYIVLIQTYRAVMTLMAIKIFCHIYLNQEQNAIVFVISSNAILKDTLMCKNIGALS